jgi:hypothetical protein
VKLFKPYNTFMLKLNCLIIILSLTISPSILMADTMTANDTKVESAMAAQVASCKANTAMEWSSTLNRCVGKAAARETRNDSMACSSIKDVDAREKCHLSLAENKTGLSADTEKLNQGGTTGSMLMNGSIAAAYVISKMFSEKGRSGLTSGCTSKKILAVTSVAGLASDLYLKTSAKKKVKELEGKYALDKTSSAYEAQLKAFEYLKEEQQTVVKIAGLEKKRNLALMLGYAVAGGFAAYEMAFPSNNPQCYEADSTDSNPAEGTQTVTATPSPPAAESFAAPEVPSIQGTVTP